MVSYLAIPLTLLIILLMALLLYWRQRLPLLRSITAFAALPDQTGQAAESGQTLHISLGTGGIGGNDTVASFASLSALAHLADQGVATGTPPVVTVSDPTLLPLAQNVLRRAYIRNDRRGDFRRSHVRLISPSPMAYALGTMDILNHESVQANVMFGAFGPEVGLIARAGQDADLIQITGTDDPQALAILHTSTSNIAVGEELYATSAYLTRSKDALISLIAEDTARIVLILLMIVIAILRLVGLV